MFKKPYGNESAYIKGREKTKEELRQRSNYLEKLQNVSRKVKGASIECSDPPPKNHLKLVPLNQQKLISTFCRKLYALIRSRITSRRKVSRLAVPQTENWDFL